jgi:guanyl-specific ribonuclease Sa
VNHRHLGGVFLLLLIVSAMLFAWHGTSDLRAAAVALHMVLTVVAVLGVIGLGLARHRGRGGSFVAAASLGGAAALFGAVGTAVGRGPGAPLILAHTMAAIAAALVLAYRWLVEERAVPAARVAGSLLLVAMALAGVGRWLGLSSAAAPQPAPATAAVQPANPSRAAAGKPSSVAAHGRLEAQLGEERARQVRLVVAAMRGSGAPPAGVAQGGRRGGEQGVFLNLEGRLPRRARGYYKETDVWPRAAGGRGAERLIFGRDGEVFYTGDHYRTFARLELDPDPAR